MEGGWSEGGGGVGEPEAREADYHLLYEMY